MTESSKKNRLIDNRYSIEDTLGVGGMATVFLAFDNMEQKKVALKRLNHSPDADPKEQSKHFENEYHTLVELAHPRVVQVYDYGIDVEGPYYTMEFLSGGDLKSRAPLHWKKTCSLMRDVCSALSLLHSRRQLHRDLTTRNVLCTHDDKAKLMDFGAMLPMGPCKKLMGTPSFTAPEAVNALSLDARSDIYSLGATAYYVLTGRHAYPARSFLDLRDAWRSQPIAPSYFAPEIPKELDELVMSLLSIAPMTRPSSAAEVMDRLNAIAGMPNDEQLKVRVSQAYLSSPTLVGRVEEVSQIRRKVFSALGGRAGAILIEGEAGVGRTRFLDACVLEAKLAGAIVARVDASDAYAGVWGGIRAIVTGLMQSLPPHVIVNLSPAFDEVRNLFPLLGISTNSISSKASKENEKESQTTEKGAKTQDIRSRVQRVLRNWLLDIGKRKLLLIAVDDIHKIDEPSAAFFALMSKEMVSERIILALTLEAGAPSNAPLAIRTFREAATAIRLENLDVSQTQELIRSVFGNVPNARLVGERIHSICKGNPRDAMQLARHLSEKGAIQYLSGVWALPSSIDSGDLPQSMSQALLAQVERLSEDARWIVECMSLDPHESFTQSELLVLAGHTERYRFKHSLDELMAAEALKSDGERYTLQQRGLVEALRNRLGEEHEKKLRARLAHMFETKRGDRFRMAQHLLHAGEEERAIKILAETSEQVSHMTAAQHQTYYEFVQNLNTDWYETFRTAIELAKKRGHPKSEICTLMLRVIAFNAVGHPSGDTSIYRSLLDDLTRAMGLDIYEQLPANLEPSERLARSFTLAEERFESLPERQRVWKPKVASSQFIRFIQLACVQLIVSYDYQFLVSLPSLAALQTSSPSFESIELMVRGVAHRLAGRDKRARAVYLDFLDRISQPDRGGMDKTYQSIAKYSISRAIGVIEASMGLESALGWASKIESHPAHEINAWHIRLSYHLWQGNARKAEICKEKVELLQIQRSIPQWFEGSHITRDLVAYALFDDLTAVRQNIDVIEEMAREFKAWKVTLHYAKGEYQRIRGNYQGALDELELALGQIEPGQHPNWPDIASAYLSTLLKLHRFEEAAQKGRYFVKQAQKEDIDFRSFFLKMPLAIAEAMRGRNANAKEIVEELVEFSQSSSTGGLTLFLIHETCARVSLCLGETADFVFHAQHCREQTQREYSRAFAMKYSKLIQEAHESNLEFSWGVRESFRIGRSSEEQTRKAIATRMLLANGCEAKAKAALEILVHQANCAGGYLYLNARGRPILVAQSSVYPPSAELTARLAAYMSDEEDLTQDVTLTITADGEEGSITGGIAWAGEHGEKLCPMLLTHFSERGHMMTGAFIFIIDPNLPFNLPITVAPMLSRYLENMSD